MKLKKLFAGILSAALIMGLFEVPMSAEDSTLLAFPGAEGGGKYTKGARAASSIEVYHVTNLNASGTGSFADAVSKSNRIIVFDVGGTIDMQGGQIKVNGSNLTILGQTAPGDGITVTGGDLLIANNMEQIIMRYIRVRPTDKYGGEPDGIGGRWNNYVIIDHCSTSWSVDEMLTLYAGSSESGTPGANLTVQNTLAAESMRMSNHFKGAHGYGGIFGATNSTWYHNLLAHHDSRSPRLDRELQRTDIRNNVIYDWGRTNSAYGGEPYSYNNKTQNGVYVNYANNYYKYGPATAASLRNRIFELSDPKDASTDIEQFYFNGNYVWGYDDVTADNTLGLKNPQYANLLASPLSMGDYEVPSETAEEAYDAVLADVGATLPKRDATDARIINDVKNQTGRIINNADEVGGYIASETTERVFEIPSDWKTANGMGTAKETDIVPSGTWAGYTWIEAYVNDWTQQQSAPTNPSITVTSPAIQDMNSLGSNNNWAVISDNEKLTYSAQATPVSGTTISKIEIYDGSTLIKTVTGASVNEQFTLTAGTHYLTSRAYNSKGEATQSDTSIVYVKSTSGAGEYTHAQIGTSNAFNGKGGAWVDDGGVYTVMGSGKLGSIASDSQSLSGVTSDSCDFMYKSVTGDFDIIARREQIPKFENGEVCGIMMRETLGTDSKMVMLADGWLKYGENVSVFSRTTSGDKSTVSYFNNSSGSAVENSSSYDTSNSNYRMPNYLRMQRSGDTITLSVSDSGLDWTDNPRQPQTVTISGLADTVYLGIAADSAQGTPMKEYMAEAKFALDPEISEEPEPSATVVTLPEDSEPNTLIFSSDFAGNGPFVCTVKDEKGNDAFTVTVLQQNTSDASKKWSYSNSYLSGSSDPAASSSSLASGAVGTTGNAPDVGTAIKITPAQYGSFTANYILNANKSLKLLKVKQGETTGTVTDSVSVTEKTTSTITFDAEIGYDYYIYGSGTKLSYGDIIFTPAAVQPTVNPTIAPTTAPTVKPTTIPTTIPTTAPTANPSESPTASPAISPTSSPAQTSSPSQTTAPSASPTTEPIQGISYDRDTKTTVITSTVGRNAAVIFAAYDENGLLTSISVKADTEIKIGKTEVSADENFKNDKTVKIFVWRTLSNMHPVMMETFE